MIKTHLYCGTVCFRKDGLWVYQVDKKSAVCDIIIPFFQKHPFISKKKQKDFLRFSELVNIIDPGNKSKTYQDIRAVIDCLNKMEFLSNRKYDDQQILETSKQFYAKNKHKIDHINVKSSETTRQT